MPILVVVLVPGRGSAMPQEFAVPAGCDVYAFIGGIEGAAITAIEHFGVRYPLGSELMTSLEVAFAMMARAASALAAARAATHDAGPLTS